MQRISDTVHSSTIHPFKAAIRMELYAGHRIHMQLILCLLLVWMPVYEGYMVHALQIVTTKLVTLPMAAATTAQQLVEAVSHVKSGLQKSTHLDPFSQPPLWQGGLTRLSADCQFYDLASSRGFQVLPLLPMISLLCRHNAYGC
jgi:hypothetical protein